jgi:hypothetical protein
MAVAAKMPEVKTETLARRERTVSLFTDRLALLKAMGLLEVTTTIYEVVVDRTGNVLAKVEGDYTKENADTLITALK